jgi:hypothetical protein
VGTGWLAGLLAGLGAPSGPVTAAEALPPLWITLDATSVSGLSAGAYMAGRIELAHSKDIVGAGIVAGGPFACAETASSRLFPIWGLPTPSPITGAVNEPDFDASPQSHYFFYRQRPRSPQWPLTMFAVPGRGRAQTPSGRLTARPTAVRTSRHLCLPRDARMHSADAKAWRPFWV